MSPRPTHCPPKAIGYVRVSTTEQADSGAGLAAQRAAIQAEADRRGWTLEFIEDAGISGARLDRPGLQAALARLDAGGADILCVAKLDRISRSVHQGSGLIDRAQRKGWSLVALDFGLDMSTPAGEMVSNVLLSTAQYERRLIGQRTKDALAAKKAAGVRLGRPQQLPDTVVQRILAERSLGHSLPVIAAALEADGIATARGGARWYPSSVKAVLDSQRANDLRS
ncbi:recombinase family protein [Paenarthrobacter ureafaciens]|uniref:recombinase family protein n=1 Tax=Paenarthrobacter ureafaciens TaxID=37931 RepID=UPI003CF2FBA4